MMVPLELITPGDVDTPAESRRAARRAYRAGEQAATARAAQEFELSRRELAAVLDVLGDALIDGDRAKTIVWYGVASRLVAKPE